MSNSLQINGAQSEKRVKATPLYVGRNTTGLWTNRSPLRDANTSRISEKYYGPSGDAMIAGSNVEVTNRLTLTRRPGNPQYDGTNTYTDILAFDEFRYSKSLSDIWGTATEQIDTMVDTATALYANNNGTSTEVLAKSTGAGQSFMQEVGTQLYFGDGIDQKKWNQSLFVRNIANDSSGLNVDAYPFMNTDLIDPNGNIQQMIGCLIATISTVKIADNVLTVTLDAQLGDNTQFPGMFDIPGDVSPIIDTGTQFVLWGFQGTAAAFLNGATITLSAPTTAGGVTLIADFTAPTLAPTSVEGKGYLQIASGLICGTPNALTGAGTITAIMPSTLVGLTTGTAVPTWGTTVPAASNSFCGSLTIDGDIIWYNRGIPTQNWGIVAPTIAPKYVANSSIAGYVEDTYFSPASIVQDGAGYLWQISTPGELSTSATPPFTASPSTATRVAVEEIAIVSATSKITVTIEAQGSPFTAGDVVSLQGMNPSSFLDGVQLTVLASPAPTDTTFVATFAYPTDLIQVQTAGTLLHGGTIVADGAAYWTCIQTSTLTNAWVADQHYVSGTYIVAPNGAGGEPAYWLLRTNQASGTGQPTVNVSNANPPVMYGYPRTLPQTPNTENFALTSVSPSGAIDTITYAASPTPNSNQMSGSLLFNYYHLDNAYLYNTPVTGNVFQGTAFEVSEYTDSWQYCAWFPLTIPSAGQYTFSMAHNSGGFYAFEPTNAAGGTATKNSGAFVTAFGQNATALKAYPTPCGTNNLVGYPSTITTDVSTWTFSAPGVYFVEIDWLAASAGTNTMNFTCNAVNIGVEPTVSGTTPLGSPGVYQAPIWVPFATSPTAATWNPAESEIYFAQTATDSGGQYTWNNIGPVSTFTRQPGIYYTLPGQAIVDTFSDEQGAYATGVSGTTTPPWSTTPNAITLDPNVPLSWINEGPVPTTATAAGKITATSKTGWTWALALVNTLDNTVSNIGPVSISSGPLTNAAPTFAPGSGLIASAIDPQADYVAIYRTTDGFTTELLIPGFGNTIYTVPLSQYMLNGYIDTTPDIGLDTQAEAAQAFENTPPLPGAINLTYYLNRLWYSIGNTVFWTSGPDDPMGNGLNGFGPNNYDKMPALVKRLVPTAIGMLVFTVSDTHVIPINSSDQIQASQPFMPGVGLSSYNALDTHGPTIGFFTTDSQFLVLSPGVSASHESVPIADQLAMRTGTPGQDWYPQNVYVAHYVSGQDMGWFLADGTNGWYRLITTPTPETPGPLWSPFATLANTGRCGAIKSVETSPGVHHLLVGPRGSDVHILNRDVLSSTDGGAAGEYTEGTPYPAYAVYGSYVLAQPGQVANILFVTLKSVKTGSPAVLGLLIDDGLPYYKGSFEILKNWVNDPPELKVSRTWYSQRFYLSDMPTESAAVTDLQIMIQWPAEAAINELQTFAIFGSYVQEG